MVLLLDVVCRRSTTIVSMILYQLISCSMRDIFYPLMFDDSEAYAYVYGLFTRKQCYIEMCRISCEGQTRWKLCLN